MSSEDAYSKKLEISYDGEGDTLWINNGGLAPIGHDITHNVLIPFFDYDYTPTSLLLFDAAELLAPHLPIEAIANASPPSHRDPIDLQIRYDPSEDTLWMGNGKPTPISAPIVEGSVVLYFYEEDGWRIPSGVTIYNAVKHIEPAILAELVELAAAGATE